jgi:hypothetical protein
MERGFGVNAFEVQTRVFLKMIWSEVFSRSEPQIPPEVASIKHALLVYLKN